MSKFQMNHSFQERIEESERVLLKYPDRVPIICEKSIGCSSQTPNIDKTKYLVPIDLTIGQFIYVIRNRMKLAPEKGLYLFINNLLPYSSQRIGELYYLEKDTDGYLYIGYTCENTFGNIK